MKMDNHRVKLAYLLFKDVRQVLFNDAFLNQVPDQKLVSVIVTSYNHESFIEEALLGLDRQTYRNIEIILVDDGSADKTYELAIKQLDSFEIPYLAIKKANQGRGAISINGAISLSYGGWIAFLASDDVFFPDKLAEQVHIAESIQADVVFGYAGQMTREGRTITTASDLNAWISSISGIIENDTLMRHKVLVQHFSLPYIGWLVSRKAFSITGNFDTEVYTEDFDFNVRLCDARLTRGFSRNVAGLHRQTRSALAAKIIDAGANSFKSVLKKYARTRREYCDGCGTIYVNAAMNKYSYGHYMSSIVDLLRAIKYSFLHVTKMIWGRLATKLRH